MEKSKLKIKSEKIKNFISYILIFTLFDNIVFKLSIYDNYDFYLKKVNLNDIAVAMPIALFVSNFIIILLYRCLDTTLYKNKWLISFRHICIAAFSAIISTIITVLLLYNAKINCVDYKLFKFYVNYCLLSITVIMLLFPKIYYLIIARCEYHKAPKEQHEFHK